MKRLIAILFVILLLIFGVIIEQTTINNYLNEIQEKTKQLILISSGKENIQTQEIQQKLQELEDTWLHHEQILCFFANHKDMRDLCIEIQKLEGNLQVNQYEDFAAGLKVIYHLADDYHYVMGTSFQNIF